MHARRRCRHPPPPRALAPRTRTRTHTHPARTPHLRAPQRCPNPGPPAAPLPVRPAWRPALCRAGSSGAEVAAVRATRGCLAPPARRPLQGCLLSGVSRPEGRPAAQLVWSALLPAPAAGLKVLPAQEHREGRRALRATALLRLPAPQLPPPAGAALHAAAEPGAAGRCRQCWTRQAPYPRQLGRGAGACAKQGAAPAAAASPLPPPAAQSQGPPACLKASTLAAS